MGKSEPKIAGGPDRSKSRAGRSGPSPAPSAPPFVPAPETPAPIPPAATLPAPAGVAFQGWAMHENHPRERTTPPPSTASVPVEAADPVVGVITGPIAPSGALHRYHSCTRDALRSILKKRGLRVSGLKDDLAMRLLENDKASGRILSEVGAGLGGPGPGVVSFSGTAIFSGLRQR